MVDNKITPENAIAIIKKHNREEKEIRNALIEEHFGFVVHSITTVTGRYVEVENSEELSIGLMAFNEAIDRFDDSKGASFLTYARLVITSRVRDYYKKKDHLDNSLSFEDVQEEIIVKDTVTDQSTQGDIAEEIEQWDKILSKFGFDLEVLVDETPKHEDTKNNALDLSEQISEDDEIVGKMFDKYRLPITMIVLKFKTTKKVVKHSKKFIIATTVVLTKNFNLIRQWIFKGRKGCSSC